MAISAEVSIRNCAGAPGEGLGVNEPRVEDSTKEGDDEEEDEDSELERLYGDSDSDEPAGDVCWRDSRLRLLGPGWGHSPGEWCMSVPPSLSLTT